MNNVIINNKKYFIAQTKEKYDEAFANINDEREITVIADQTKLKQIKPLKVEKDFRLITFDMELPFSMTGFIAKVSTSLANANIPIFLISAYSTDHILVKSKFVDKAKTQLNILGFKVIEI